jgi:hypothetical protein
MINCATTIEQIADPHLKSCMARPGSPQVLAGVAADLGVVTERRRPDTGPQLAGSVGRYTDPNSATRLNNIRVDRVYPIRCVITVASITGHTHSKSGTFRTPHSPERSM